MYIQNIKIQVGMVNCGVLCSSDLFHIVILNYFSLSYTFGRGCTPYFIELK